MDHPRLVFGRKGGGGGGIRVERLEITTSGSRLDAREVVVVGVTSKRRNQPPPARVWTRGRWQWWQGLRVSFCPGDTSVNQWEWGWKIRTAKMSHDENRGSFFRDAPFAPPGSYPPLAPRSFRIFAHADGPTSLMRGEGHLAGGILVVVGGNDVT